ncbi:bifunctional 3-phenylpropionate/cinnamic acid dioxygenase ferredoxin subunit [Mycolicibacterium frederiksbergense]|uniref:Bifunctional 3-phenylpropionate/cinnamic acid dioxygenase ferredoxin subunit n=1 Tax=Mycolicibacterium frederiksbergense TaxID=117567 RepID=A0A6H0RYK3_9MYCO|nr:bifunctional 3-phenylpropionate/cinnamic acid dioxygenase ferredoxin subunit [Mycolicibacterium frederiksbergense]QIV79996.1 bifunctional 3-phenylpropionate/cinnamic acid dioxygenase ferredoxin subunit [Mycolicibacterium frederiksbergense]
MLTDDQAGHPPRQHEGKSTVLTLGPSEIYLCDTTDVSGEGLRIERPELPEPIAVISSEGQYFAVSDTCSHADASLAEGFVENCQVECPMHFAKFDLTTGRACSLPAIFPIKTYPIQIVDQKIHLTLSD